MKRRNTDRNNIIAHLERVAFWQLAVFVIMLCLIWLNEATSLASLFFDVKPENANIFRAFSLTIVTLICAIITVGHTYLQEKLIIRDLIKICSTCHKVQIDEAAWAGMDKYLYHHSLVEFSHGICPQCAEKSIYTSNEKNMTQSDKKK